MSSLRSVYLLFCHVACYCQIPGNEFYVTDIDCAINLLWFLISRARLTESEAMAEVLRRSALRNAPSRMSVSPGTMPCMTSLFSFNASPDEHIQDILCAAKKDVK